jgi:hypothetical protein
MICGTRKCRKTDRKMNKGGNKLHVCKTRKEEGRNKERKGTGRKKII